MTDVGWEVPRVRFVGEDSKVHHDGSESGDIGDDGEVAATVVTDYDTEIIRCWQRTHSMPSWNIQRCRQQIERFDNHLIREHHRHCTPAIKHGGYTRSVVGCCRDSEVAVPKCEIAGHPVGGNDRSPTHWVRNNISLTFDPLNAPNNDCAEHRNRNHRTQHFAGIRVLPMFLSGVVF